MPRIRLADGVCLNLATYGAGPPLLLLHGFTGSAAGWRAHAEQFAAHATVVAVDLLGHGESDAPADPARYRMERCIEDLRSILDLLGLQRSAVLGYSMGGRVALGFTLAHSERVDRLILESASPGPPDAQARSARMESDEAVAARIEREGLPAFVRYWESLPLFASQARLPEADRQALRAARLGNNAIGLAASLRGLGVGAQRPYWEQLGQIRRPTLVLVGRQDPTYVDIGRAMAGAIPGARLEIVPDAGHTVHLEQPAEFDRVVVDFLKSERTSPDGSQVAES